MREVIKALVQLQEIDNEVHRFAQQKEKLAHTLNELKELVSKMEQSVEDKKTKLADVENWYQDQVETLKEYNERMTRIKASLQAVTKTKDYLVRQKELENLRRHKQAKEEEIQKVRETIADFKDAIARDQDKISELRKDTEDEGGSTWEQVRQLEGTIAEISKTREHLLPIVPRAILSKYERIKDKRDGLAIVDSTDGSCGGCHVALRAQLFNTLLKMESLENCPMCTRYVYVCEETIAEMMSADEGSTS